MDNQSPTPVPFTPDAFFGPGIPHQAKAIHCLDHGEVVCAVTINNATHQIYTGGKGTVKLWDLNSTTSNQSPNCGGSSGQSIITNKTCITSLECLQRDKYIRSIKLTQVNCRIVLYSLCLDVCWILIILFVNTKNYFILKLDSVLVYIDMCICT